jgi:hypothetical protein
MKFGLPTILFFTLCIPIRIVIAYIAYLISNHLLGHRLIFALCTFIIGISFMTIYVMGWRKTGIETMGEKIWWNSLRPVHSLLFIAVSIGLLYDIKWIWMLLVLDIIIGITAKVVMT